MTENEENLHNELTEWYDAGFGYNTITLPDGYTLKGFFDMSKVIQHYQIPDNLNGKTVLDIGASNGYFSFEFSKRGAKVTAIDNYDDWWNEKLVKIMKEEVDFRIMDINDLDESFGKFDIVFCSNVLTHIKDIYSCIEKIRSVTKEKAILATQLSNHSELDNTSFVEFYGTKFHVDVVNRTYGTWWLPGLDGFKKMVEVAGFKSIKNLLAFPLPFEPHKPEAQAGIPIRMGVMHAYV